MFGNKQNTYKQRITASDHSCSHLAYQYDSVDGLTIYAKVCFITGYELFALNRYISELQCDHSELQYKH